jgi:predicted nucleic acid-binding protein
MKEKVFVDTNIFIYLKLKDKKNEDKKSICSDLFRKIKNRITISTQVINEFYNVMLRNGLSDSKIQEMVGGIIEISMVSLLTLDTIKQSWKIKERYRISIWDSLIIASALENNCKILYTEDIQHKQLIENKLRIINPFQDNVID